MKAVFPFALAVALAMGSWIIARFQSAKAATPLAAERSVSAPAATPHAAEMAARQFLARVAGGDMRGSMYLAAETGVGQPPPPDWLVRLIGLRPQVEQVFQLPTPMVPGGDMSTPSPDDVTAPGTTDVLAWARYRQPDAETSRGLFRVQLAWQNGPPGAWRVVAVTGPVIPPGGYQPFSVALFDRTGRLVPSHINGPAIIWSPRRPEADLLTIMNMLHQRFGTRVAVQLVLDLASPGDWERYATANGWTGPVLRAKQPLDRIPVPQVQSYLGAVGVLVDRRGKVVASLGALDPARYGLDPSASEYTADLVLRAYGLTD